MSTSSFTTGTAQSLEQYHRDIFATIDFDKLSTERRGPGKNIYSLYDLHNICRLLGINTSGQAKRKLIASIKDLHDKSIFPTQSS